MGMVIMIVRLRAVSNVIFRYYSLQYFYFFNARLFLESNPIPAKKALELMGKIGACCYQLYILEYFDIYMTIMSSQDLA